MFAYVLVYNRVQIGFIDDDDDAAADDDVYVRVSITSVDCFSRDAPRSAQCSAIGRRRNKRNAFAGSVGCSFAGDDRINNISDW